MSGHMTQKNNYKTIFLSDSNSETMIFNKLTQIYLYSKWRIAFMYGTSTRFCSHVRTIKLQPSHNSIHIHALPCLPGITSSPKLVAAPMFRNEFSEDHDIGSTYGILIYLLLPRRCSKGTYPTLMILVEKWSPPRPAAAGNPSGHREIGKHLTLRSIQHRNHISLSYTFFFLSRII